MLPNSFVPTLVTTKAVLLTTETFKRNIFLTFQDRDNKFQAFRVSLIFYREMTIFICFLIVFALKTLKTYFNGTFIY